MSIGHRTGSNPHPALRATFSRREKGPKPAGLRYNANQDCSCVALGRCSRRGAISATASALLYLLHPCSRTSMHDPQGLGMRILHAAKYLPMPPPSATMQLFRTIPLHRVRKRSPTGWAPTGERYRLSLGAHPVRDLPAGRQAERSEGVAGTASAVVQRPLLRSR